LRSTTQPPASRSHAISRNSSFLLDTEFQAKIKTIKFLKPTAIPPYLLGRTCIVTRIPNWVRDRSSLDSGNPHNRDVHIPASPPHYSDRALGPAPRGRRAPRRSKLRYGLKEEIDKARTKKARASLMSSFTLRVPKRRTGVGFNISFSLILLMAAPTCSPPRRACLRSE
jgi:hypothetical protein